MGPDFICEQQKLIKMNYSIKLESCIFGLMNKIFVHIPAKMQLINPLILKSSSRNCRLDLRYFGH